MSTFMLSVFRRFFNPRSPRGGATGGGGYARRRRMVFNPRSPRGGATHAHIAASAARLFSILAPHEGERHCRHGRKRQKHSFSILAPHEGERLKTIKSTDKDGRFQSSLPTRGSDAGGHKPPHGQRFSILAPHEGERQMVRLDAAQAVVFSILAPHEGERHYYLTVQSRDMVFNPRSPRGGATGFGAFRFFLFYIFNPRSPRGGATALYDALIDATAFSILAPHEGERRSGGRSRRRGDLYFQSSLPTRGSDIPRKGAGASGEFFNPRSPRGGATRHDI